MPHIQEIFLEFIKWGESIVPKLIGATLIFTLGWWAAKRLSELIKKVMEKGHVDAGIISFTHSVCKVCFQIIILLSAIATLGININSIVAALGATLVTIGLALKDSLSNIASGTLIIVNKPFHVGDYLQIEGLEGTVEKIDLMFTTLSTSDKKEVILPNSKLTSSSIINHTAQKIRRLDLIYPVGYHSDFRKIHEILNTFISSSVLAIKDPKPSIAISAYKENYMEICVKIWCKSENYSLLSDQIQEKVKEIFDQKSMEPPSPQLNVSLKN